MDEAPDLLKLFFKSLDAILDDLKWAAEEGIFRDGIYRKWREKHNEYGVVAYKNWKNRLFNLNILNINKEICRNFKDTQLLKFSQLIDVIIEKIERDLNILIKKLFEDTLFPSLDQSSFKVVKDLREETVREILDVRRTMLDHFSDFILMFILLIHNI
jgi:hypothetical protein